MMKRILAVLVLVSVMLIPGCQNDKYSGEFKNDQEVAEYVEKIINKKYSCYFDDKLYYSDYGTPDEGVFYATVYMKDEKYEFGVEYDIKNKTLAIAELIPQLDERIDSVSEGWPTSRLGKTELSIMRLAVYEMLYDDDIPVNVAIDEAVELAKKYGSADNTAAFVNGVLAKLIKE